MKYTQEELDKLKDEPAFNIDPTEQVEENKEAEVEQVKPEVKEPVSDSTETESVADKARVPYSRFESVHERAIRAETELKLLQAQQAQLGQSDVSQENDFPDEWKALLGDSEEGRKAYQLLLKQNQKTYEEAAEKTYERIINREKEEQEIVKKNLESIEDSLNTFSESLGRKLTEAEESSILDIQDEFTPKGEDGKYIAPLLSPDKAYEIYTLRTNTAKVAKTQARRNVAAITGSGSEGNVSISSSGTDAYRWGGWRDKL